MTFVTRNQKQGSPWELFHAELLFVYILIMMIMTLVLFAWLWLLVSDILISCVVGIISSRLLPETRHGEPEARNLITWYSQVVIYHLDPTWLPSGVAGMETTPSKHGTLWEKHIYLTFTNTATYPDQQLRDPEAGFWIFCPSSLYHQSCSFAMPKEPAVCCFACT